MKKLILCLLTSVFALSLSAQGPYGELDARLENYLAALVGESAGMQSAECDFLIGSCQDSLVRQHVALKIYDHYLHSRVMGEEAVAVHVAREWFLSGKVAMASEMDLLNARVFVEFNQASLVGMQAPRITALSPDGSQVEMPGEGYSVLYFYDTGCSTCKVESARLKTLVREEKYPVSVYALYVGHDGAAWQAYRDSFPGVTHVWSPEDASWQQLYGVLQTPRLFLVGPDGAILGRGLDTPALRLLLEEAFSSGEYVYGAPAQMERYAQLFAAYGDSLSVQSIMETADYLAARTLAEGYDEAFRQVMGDLLYFLSSQKEEVYRDAAIPFVQKYIDIPDIWSSGNAQAQVVSLGKMLSSLAGRTPAGSLVPDLRVDGVLRRKPCLFARDGRQGQYALRKLKGNPAHLVFYTGGCSSCRETLSAVESLVKENPRARVLLVDMDALQAANPAQAALLLEQFDLSVLPMVIELDRRGVIQHRYVQL